ncbi:MAG: Zn-dependent exopeptidase M28 [Gemmataceae bacterium]|nr:Zn-dependent exopeptidase M28 [Gemmataceae bacterium]
MMPTAWDQLLADPHWCRGRGRFPLPAYSEFLPPPWMGVKPCGTPQGLPDVRAGGHGWNVSEYEEDEVWPGLERVSRVVLDECRRLAEGRPMRSIPRASLKRNPAWPANLAALAGRLHHERFVLLLNVALTRTQDDKGRVRWTLLGTSEQGPGKAFWRGFFAAPGEEAPWSEAEGFFAELLSRCHGEPESAARDLGRAGVRVLPRGHDEQFPHWSEGELPSWTDGLRYRRVEETRYLLTFRPFAELPDEVQAAYCEGRLRLWPFPGSLLFWYDPLLRKLCRQLPFAMQVPLLDLFHRVHDPAGLRIPQSGWFHEGAPAAREEDAPAARRERVARTHRWQRVERHQDDVEQARFDAPIARALFSTGADDLRLYDKPLARQAQVWTPQGRLVLDGLRHRGARIERAAEAVDEGGRFGYRFVWPSMRVGPWQVHWQVPVCAFAHDGPTLLLHGPAGWLTAYEAAAPHVAHPVELWPRFLDRPPHKAARELFRDESHPHRGHTAGNVRAVLEWHEMLGPLAPSLARALVDCPDRHGIDAWLESLPAKASDPVAGQALADRLRSCLGAEPEPGEGLTFAATATRAFEEGYWRTIAELSSDRFANKSTGDPVPDAPTKKARSSARRGLDALRRHLVRKQSEAVAGHEGAWVGLQRFAWHTEFDYPWMQGWRRNQHEPSEANILVRIPGRDPSQAVLLCDHYDTAYMHDVYDKSEGGAGARLAAAGADDNASATALLLLATPVLLALSEAGMLARDVWLVHLTGEEFPADCLGARMLAQALVQRTLEVKTEEAPLDLSETAIKGVFVADMIAHGGERHANVFQIAPGETPASAQLARTAHEATRAWNALAKWLNRKGDRRKATPPRRSTDPERIPTLSPHALLKGEVRPDWTPRSTLFNTDGQIFSDAGLPTVLFMEDYDIDRKGYHDTHDTMGLIDLDYGAALAAVVLETVARAASSEE